MYTSSSTGETSDDKYSVDSRMSDPSGYLGRNISQSRFCQGVAKDDRLKHQRRSGGGQLEWFHFPADDLLFDGSFDVSSSVWARSVQRHAFFDQLWKKQRYKCFYVRQGFFGIRSNSINGQGLLGPIHVEVHIAQNRSAEGSRGYYYWRSENISDDCIHPRLLKVWK